MSNPRHRPDELGPRGPEGVPLDAPGNEGPALSPHAVSRMHRAEDDAEAARHSPFSDEHSVAQQGAGGGDTASSHSDDAGPRDHSDRALDRQDAGLRPPNPSHDTRKRAGDPDGLGDGELMEQPESTSEARDPGADSPPLDK